MKAYLPLEDLLCGCKKVNELVPKVLLARFHNESLPFRPPTTAELGDPPSEGFEFDGDPSEG